MTEVLRVDAGRPDPASIAVAATRLRDGGLVAFPTETVYGLGAHALVETAVKRIFEAKRRPADDPLIVHVASLEAVMPLVATTPRALHAIAGRFWPGPLTVVLARAERVPRIVTAGLDTVAVRVPAHPVAHALLVAADIPVAAPSANLFSRPSPTTAAHVLEDLDGRIDLVLDAGATNIGLESTVIDLSTSRPRLLRQGAVPIEALAALLPGLEAVAQAAPGTPVAAPGMLLRHYSPRAPLTLYTGSAPLARLLADVAAAEAAGHRVGVLAVDEDLPTFSDVHATVAALGPANDPARVAQRLYHALRELDRTRPDRILVRDFDGDGGLCPAIRDRLRRAAAGRIIVT